jgi:ABC-type antimicrobial peptide transport system permease subunit
VAIGGAAGLLLALGLARLLSSQLYGVSAFDPVIFVSAPLLLILVSTIATLIPAQRAARVNPVDALRTEG